MTVQEVQKLTNGERVYRDTPATFATVFVHEGRARLLWEGGAGLTGSWEEVTPEAAKGLQLLQPGQRQEKPEKPSKNRGMPRPDISI